MIGGLILERVGGDDGGILESAREMGDWGW
jgi:hypothetical protein